MTWERVSDDTLLPKATEGTGMYSFTEGNEENKELRILFLQKLTRHLNRT